MQREISVPFVAFSDAGDPLDINMVINANRFEELTKDLVDRTIEVCAASSRQRTQTDQIDEGWSAVKSNARSGKSVRAR